MRSPNVSVSRKTGCGLRRARGAFRMCSLGATGGSARRRSSSGSQSSRHEAPPTGALTATEGDSLAEQPIHSSARYGGQLAVGLSSELAADRAIAVSLGQESLDRQLVSSRLLQRRCKENSAVLRRLVGGELLPVAPALPLAYDV